MEPEQSAIHIKWSGLLASSPPGRTGMIVITSYSIHYTKLYESLVLGGEKRYITAFFSDIRNFTTISEQLQPEELVELLNRFLTEMTDIILRYEGTVDKFEGDAIIAFFGAPNHLENHAQMACRRITSYNVCYTKLLRFRQ